MNKTDIENASDLIYKLETLDEFFDRCEDGWVFDDALSSKIDNYTSQLRSVARCLPENDMLAISKYVTKKLKARQRSLVEELEGMGVSAEI